MDEIFQKAQQYLQEVSRYFLYLTGTRRHFRARQLTALAKVPMQATGRMEELHPDLLNLKLSPYHMGQANMILLFFLQGLHGTPF